MKAITSTFVIISSLFLTTQCFSKEVILLCKLQVEYKGSFPSSQEKKIDKTFVLMFDDEENQVTYVGGPRMVPDNTSKRYFENSILFSAKSPDISTVLNYSGTVNRITGSINLTTKNIVDGKIDEDTRITQEGICDAVKRKF